MEPITAALFFIITVAMGEENKKQDRYMMHQEEMMILQQFRIEDLEEDLYVTDETLRRLVGSHSAATAALKVENERLQNRVRYLEKRADIHN